METAHFTAKFLKEVRFGGRRIILSDQSVWDIAPRQRENTWFWRLTSKITVARGNDLCYPYHLINQDLGDIIDARPAEVCEPA